eukprot:12406517-Karenia_brevis.AAC.1
MDGPKTSVGPVNLVRMLRKRRCKKRSINGSKAMVRAGFWNNSSLMRSTILVGSTASARLVAIEVLLDLETSGYLNKRARLWE